MTAKTARLHYDDSLALSAPARVLAHGTWKDQPSVILDRTPLYPESGGQLGDHGVLVAKDRRFEVVDTQIDADGQVHHLVGPARPSLGSALEVEVEPMRRRSHMALHTGQHALSRAMLDTHGAVTISSRLGASACTLDVDKKGLDLDAVRRAEDVVNRLVDEDRPVASRFVEEAELAALALRKPPPDTDRVRIVTIEGFDTTPCGGTHAVSTAQIELLTIVSVENYKGGTRITFEAGPRARSALQRDAKGLREAAAELGCAPAEVTAILLGQRSKLDAARAEAGALRAQLAEAWARSLDSGAAGPEIVAAIEGADPALLKAIALRLATGARVLVLTAPVEGGTHLVVARGPDATTHAGKLLSRIAAEHGGRGGGRPELAQGRLPEGVVLEAPLLDALG